MIESGHKHDSNQTWLYRPCKELKTIQDKCDCPHYVVFTELLIWDACEIHAIKWYPAPKSDDDVNLSILEDEA